MVFLPCRERIAMLCRLADHEGRLMGLGCSRDGGAAARAVKRPSFHWIRSRCCSMRLPGKRVSSLLPEAKQSIARREAEVTVQQVTSHCISRCILLSIGFSIHLWQFIFSMGVG